MLLADILNKAGVLSLVYQPYPQWNMRTGVCWQVRIVLCHHGQIQPKKSGRPSLDMPAYFNCVLCNANYMYPLE